MKINENPMCVVCFPAAISGSDCPQVLSCNSALEMVWHRFIAKLRAVVKQCWELLFGSSDKKQWHKLSPYEQVSFRRLERLCFIEQRYSYQMEEF